MSENLSQPPDRQREFREKPRKVILEIGYGKSPYFEMYGISLPKGSLYIGADIHVSEEVKNFFDDPSIQSEFQANDIRTQLVATDRTHIDLPDQSVDEAVLNNFITDLNIPDKEIAVVRAEVKRVLKPGGKLTIYNAEVYDVKFAQRARVWQNDKDFVFQVNEAEQERIKGSFNSVNLPGKLGSLHENVQVYEFTKKPLQELGKI